MGLDDDREYAEGFGVFYNLVVDEDTSKTGGEDETQYLICAGCGEQITDETCMYDKIGEVAIHELPLKPSREGQMDDLPCLNKHMLKTGKGILTNRIKTAELVKKTQK